MIDAPSSATRNVRFGPFELDLRSGELRKNGFRVALQDQPLQILSVLLEHPGELVSREELRQRLWPADTFVDFEHGLNAAVKRLRDALGDSADTPRFVETIPRRGYRFAVETLRRPAGLQADHESSAAKNSMPAVRFGMNLVTRRRLLTAMAAVALAVGTIWLYESHSATSHLVMRIVPVTSFAGLESHPALSHDGKQVAFVWRPDGASGYDLYVKLLEGGDALRLTDTPESESSPTWSPDDTRIAFLRDLPTATDQARRGVFVISALGGGEHRLGFAGNLGLSWSPDGRTLAIADRGAPGEATGISLLSLESGRSRQVTHQVLEPAGDWWPVFSPDGDAIAFISGGADASIYVMPTSGGGRRRLTPGGARAFGVAWAPDGRSLVYASNQGGGTRARLFRVSISGGSPEPLPIGEEPASWPSLSQNGDRMVFSREMTDWNIWRVEGPNATVSAKPPPMRLISSTRSEWAPAFSPDGTRVAFTSDRAGLPQIWTSDADGRQPIQLTAAPQGAMGPRWSPDGDRIVYFDRGFNVFEVSRDGGPPRAVTSDDSFNVFPSWSVDAQWIYFDRYRNRNVWRTRIGGARTEEITRGGGMQPIPSNDGRYVYYVRLFEPGIWRVPAIGGNEEKITDRGDWNRWDVYPEGLCFVDVRTGPHPVIKCLRFASGRVETILALEKPVPNGGLSISRDGRWIAYTQVDTSESDLLLVEGFHWTAGLLACG